MTPKENAKAISDALKSLADRNGHIIPDVVVKAARERGHILHPLFIWSNKAAADVQRIERARELIARYVSVEVVNRDHRFMAPYYVRDPDSAPDKQGYVAVTTAALDRRKAEAVMRAELDRCASMIERARNVVAVLDIHQPGLSARLESLLADIVDLRDRIAAE